MTCSNYLHTRYKSTIGTRKVYIKQVFLKHFQLPRNMSKLVVVIVVILGTAAEAEEFNNCKYIAIISVIAY